MSVGTILYSDSLGTSQVAIDSVEIKNRILWVDDDVSPTLINQLIRKISLLSLENSKQPIKLCINTDGGSIEDGLALYDVIVNSTVPIYTLVVARAYSMGGILLSAGTKRFALSHSRIMLHQARINQISGGTENDVDEYVKNLRYFDNILVDILAKRTDKSIKEIKKTISYDHYFTAEEAKDFNLIDDIITLDAFINLA